MGIAEKKGDLHGLVVISALPVVLFLTALLLNTLYSLPLSDSVLFFAVILVYLYIPGNVLLRLLDIREGEYFTRFFHSLALGTALMPLLYSILRRLSRPDWLYISGAGIFLIWLVLTVADVRKNRLTVRAHYKDLLSFLFLFAIVFLLLHFSHFTDVVFSEKGFSVRNSYLTETIFHLGIIKNLENFFPPLYPYATGHDFSHYHLNMYLETEMLHRITSVDSLKLTFFYLPLLYFSLLVFVPYMLVRRYTGSMSAGVLTGLLMFGSDFSFIPGILGMVPADYPWTYILNTTIWSLFTLNGYLPVLFIMFLCIYYLKKYYDDGRLPHILIFALLGYSANGFKSSAGFHIMGAAFLTGIISIAAIKDKRRGVIAVAVSFITALVFVADIVFLRGSIRGQQAFGIIDIDFFNRFRFALEAAGIREISWLLYPLAFVVYIAFAFGVKTLGFYLLKDIFRNKFDPLLVFLVLFITSGFILAEALSIVLPSSDINNAVWLSSQSLMAAWLLLSYFIARTGYSGKKLFVLAAMLLTLSCPSTIQFLCLRYDHNYYTLDSEAMEVVQYLRSTPPASVVLHPPNYEGPSLASNLTGRASVISIFRSFSPDWIGMAEERSRLRDVRAFFNPSLGIDRTSILRKYKVNYIYAPFLYVRIFDKDPLLIRVLKNSGYVVYKVAGQAG